MYSEKQIISGCKKQNPVFQRILYEKYFQKMLGICMRYSKSPEEAEDVLQDGFIKVFNKIRSFRTNKNLEGWIVTIIKNTAIDHARKGFKIFSELNENISYPDDDEGEFKDTLSELPVQEIVKIIQWLPIGYRTVLNMYAIENMSHKEIAEKLGISISTSKSQLYKARKMLKTLVMNKVEKICNDVER